MNKPYSIKIFFPGGDPDGLRTIEKSNWSGAGIVIPRALMGEAKSRRELGRTGVYVLVGPPEESGLPRVYFGEGDPIKPRLEQHSSKKDFWTSCIAFTSKDENMNKAHDGFVVRAGSGTVKGEVPSCHAFLKELRSALISNGGLKPSGAGYTFAQDYVFPSPSTAAGGAQGRAANGRVDWKTKDGRTLKDLQEAIAKE